MRNLRNERYAYGVIRKTIDPSVLWLERFAPTKGGHIQEVKQPYANSGCPGPEVIKHFSCSTQLSMKFFLLINLKVLTTANSFLLNIAEHENFSANKYENANSSWHFHFY